MDNSQKLVFHQVLKLHQGSLFIRISQRLLSNNTKKYRGSLEFYASGLSRDRVLSTHLHLESVEPKQVWP